MNACKGLWPKKRLINSWISWILTILSTPCSALHERKHQSTYYTDVIMTTMASQITSLMVVYSTVYSEADQRKPQSSASLAFVGEFTGTGTGEFPTQRASYAENVSIWWRHHGITGHLRGESSSDRCIHIAKSNMWKVFPCHGVPMNRWTMLSLTSYENAITNSFCYGRYTCNILIIQRHSNSTFKIFHHIKK